MAALAVWVKLLRRWLAGWLVLSLAIAPSCFLTGCRPTEFRTAAAQVPQLVLTSLSDPKTFNPAFNQEFPNVFLFTEEHLLRENGVTGEVEPALAESWSISTDKQRVIFTLRPNLQWSDGQPLTAADVVFTFAQVIFNSKIPTDYADSLRIGTNRAFPQVQQLDDRRVEFILPEPFAPLLRSLAGHDGAPILPQHVLERSLQQLSSDGNPQFISTWSTATSPKQLVVNGP
ncbi:MAG TPA: ABC transporter substrate-binding protein, partial [Candidatus Obscuribacterales bacterium]